MTLRIYHNPHCSKSRAALALLEYCGVDFEVVEHLRDPPAKATLSALLAKLHVRLLDLVRTNEPEYEALPPQAATRSKSWSFSCGNLAPCSGPSSRARTVP